jgi:hypothetical protein
MKKNFIITASIFLGVAASSTSIIAFEGRAKSDKYQIASESTVKDFGTIEDEELLSLVNAAVKEKEALIRQQEETEYAKQKEEEEKKKEIKSAKLKEEEEQKKIIAKSTESTYSAAAPSKGSSAETVYSRGGTPPAQKSSVEILDWWKDGRAIFAVNTTAVVTDLYSGKSFNVKRTYGTNHADAEALTKEDTNTIKSIWGGFSWTRRPVILNINGRRLAASMSAMPHSGLDSAAPNVIVDNRSDGYSRGENLDAIKGNGMDGHFDIHFLNSTRHKDGQKDPQHQTAVMKAAGR